MLNKSSKIYVAGHRGLVGSAILNNLKQKGYNNFVLRTHKELDLTDQNQVATFFASEKPEYVILAAAKVGGILANNQYRADFIYQNLMIQNNVIHQAYVNKVKKLIFLGSTCIYPRDAQQPIKEDSLLTAPLEYTNEPYAIAKIAGIKMCESYNLQYETNFISVMPTNLYGPNDNFDLETSHVLPAIIRKLHIGKLLMEGDWNSLRKDLELRPVKGISKTSTEDDIAKKLCHYGIVYDSKNKHCTVRLWGTGKPMREFLWSEDMADATTYIMENVNFSDITSVIRNSDIKNTHINIGTGKDLSIKETTDIISQTIQYKGEIEFDDSKPDGTMRKVTDVSKLHELGWKYSIEIKEGIKLIYDWYINNK